ncbi:MAG: hypothetical protein JOZ37_16125 [Actinobacteria bacterium]|nr:hypothetical protein [Actinomycetota bacterium]
MSVRRGLAVALAATLSLGIVGAPAAHAAKPAAQGWWRSSLNVLGIDLTALLDPSTVDVPADGLLVAGSTTAGQPEAIAAVAYTVQGTVAGPLRLVPHAATATVPGSGAMACPLDNPTFKPAQGGLIENAPKYDCLGAVTAKVDSDGAYVFDVSTLVRGDAVAVAILPTTQTSRIVFASPGDDSLLVKAEAPAPALPSATADAATGSFGDAALSPPLPGAVLGNETAAPGPAAEAAPTASITAPTAVAPIGATAPTPGRGSAGRAFLFLAIAAAIGVAWVVAGRPRRRSAAP